MRSMIPIMKPDYSLDDLRLFWLVARSGSYKKASQESGVPLSTLSRRISVLEDALTVRLLERNAHRVTLTESGEEYLDRCGPLFDELNDITHQLYSAKQSAKGKLHVAAPINLAQQWFVSLLSRFMLQYPQIDIELTISNKNIDLIENHVDLAIRVGEMTTPDWIARHLTDIPFCLCMSTAMMNTEVSLSHPQALIHYPVVVSKPVQHWRLIHSVTQEEFNFDVAAKARFKVDDLHTAMNATLAGIGIGLFPVTMVAPYIADGKLQIVLPEWQGRKRPVYLLYRDRVNMPHRLRLLIDFILEQIPAEIHYRGQSC